MSDKVLGLDLSNFNRQVKLKPELRDDHKIIAVMSNDLWFRIDEVNEETSTRRNAEKTEAQPEALTLRTKVKANKWLHFTPRVGARGGGRCVSTRTIKDCKDSSILARISRSCGTERGQSH